MTPKNTQVQIKDSSFQNLHKKYPKPHDLLNKSSTQIKTWTPKLHSILEPILSPKHGFHFLDRM